MVPHFFSKDEKVLALTTVNVVKSVARAISAKTRKDLAGNLLLDFLFQLGKSVRAGLKPNNNKNRVQTQRLFLGKTLCGLVVACLKRVCSRSARKSITALFFFNSVEVLGLLVDPGFLSVRWPLRQLHAAAEVDELHPFVVLVNMTLKNLRATFSFLAKTDDGAVVVRQTQQLQSVPDSSSQAEQQWGTYAQIMYFLFNTY